MTNVEDVDFQLPPLTPVYLPGNSVDTLTVYLGTSAWGHKEWKGNFFPKKTPAKEFLQAYSNRCNAVEMNTTFYRTPTIEQIQIWLDQVPDDFRFCPKVLKYISQSRDLGVETERFQLFIDHILHIGQKLGTIFLQLPPFFDPKRFPILQRFLSVIPEGLPIAVEVRNESWFKDGSITELAQTLSKRNQGLVITDVAGRRDAAHMCISADYTMIRFGGNGGHSSDYTRMSAWLDTMLEMKNHGVKSVYFFIHQNDPLITAQQIGYMQKMITSRAGLATREIQTTLRQGELF